MSADAGRWACDTSVAVAAVDPNHEAHDICRAIVTEHRPVLAGHAAFETYAVLTRLPPPARVDGPVAQTLLREVFGEPCWLEGITSALLLQRLAGTAIVGGATFDALVAAASDAHERVLLTRDRRAQRTYRLLGVDYVLIEG